MGKFLSLFVFLVLMFETAFAFQDTSVVRGSKIVIKPLNGNILKTKTNDPETDKLFNDYTVDQLALILKKSQEKIKLSKSEEQRLSDLINENNERFIKTFKKSAILDEIIMRQAEIVYAKAIDDYRVKSEDYENKLTAYFEKVDQFDKGELKEKPVQPTAPTKDMSKVLGLYDYIIDQIPESKFVDDALYNKAYIQGYELGDGDVAIRSLELLTRKYPNSSYTLDANMLIGEFLFSTTDDAKLRRAKSHYQKVLELSAESPIPTARYEQSLYRLAWVSFKLRQLSEAIAYFTFLLDDIENNKTLFEDSPTPSFFIPVMYNEAAEYIGISFMDLAKNASSSGNSKKGVALEKMVKYFSNFNPPKAYEPYTYERLAQSYQAIDELEETTIIFDYLLKKYPDSERSSFYAKEIIEIKTRQTNDKTGLQLFEAREELYGLRDVYFKSYYYNGDWFKNQLAKYEAQNSSQADGEKVRGVVHRFIDQGMFTETDSISQQYLVFNLDQDLYYSLVFQGDQSENGISKDTLKAKELFNRFVRDAKTYYNNYSKYDSIGYENSYNIAIVYDQYLHQPLEAYRFYIDVSRNPYSEKYRAISSRNAISIAQSQLIQDEKITVKPTIASLPRARAILSDSTLSAIPFLAYVDTLPVSRSENRLIEAYDNFTRLYPHVPQSQDYLENVSLLYFNKNQLDKVAGTQVVLQKYYPGKQINSGYVTDLMKGYFFVKDYPTAEQLAKSVVYMQSSTDKQKEYAHQIWFTSIYEYATIYEGRNENSFAAKQFYRAYKEIPDNKDADKALFKSAENYDKAKEFTTSIPIYNELIEKFPKSADLILQSHKNIYANYREMKDYENASKQAERMYNTYNDDPELAEQYLFQAQQNAKEAKNYSEAVRLSELYVEKFPKSQYASEILFGTISLNQSLGNTEGIFDSYGKFADQYPDDPRSVEALYRRGLYLENQKSDKDGALVEYGKAADRNRALSKRGLQNNPFYAAEALYKLGFKLRDEFSAYKITYTNSKTVTPQKTAARDKYWANQKEIIDLSPLGRGVEASYNIATSQEELSEQIANRNAEDGGISGEQFMKEQENVFLDAVDEYNFAYQINIQIHSNFMTYKESIAKLNEQSSASQKTDSLATQDSLKLNDSTAVAENKPAIPDSIVKQLYVYDSLVTNKTAEMLYKAASSKTKVAYLYLDNKKDLLVALQKLPKALREDANIIATIKDGLIQNVTPDIDESIGLFKKNIDLSKENNVENEWVEKSRQAIVDLSDLKASRYQMLVQDLYDDLDKKIEAFRGLVEVDNDPGSDNIINEQTQITTAIEGVQNFVSNTITEYVNALNVVDANNLSKDLRLQVENRVTEFLFNTGTRSLDKSDYVNGISKNYEKVAAADYNKYWYTDAQYSMSDLGTQYKTTGLQILENGIQFMNQFGVFTPATGRIITKLVEVDPVTYGKLLGDVDLRSSFTVSTDDDWKVTTSVSADDWYTLNVSDSSWSNAEVSYGASDLVVDIYDSFIGPKSVSVSPIWAIAEDVQIENSTDKNSLFYFSKTDTIPPDSSANQADKNNVHSETVLQDSSLVTNPENNSAPDSLSVSQISDTSSVKSDTTVVLTQSSTLSTSPVAETLQFSKIKAVESADNLSLKTSPSVVFFRKTLVIDGTIESALLSVGLNVHSEVYVNGAVLDSSAGKVSYNKQYIQYDVSKLLNKGKNLIAIKGDGSISLNRNLYALSNIVYYPEIPSEKVLKLFGNTTTKKEESSKEEEPQQPQQQTEPSNENKN